MSAARWGTRRLPFRSRWAVLAAAEIYGAIGRKVRERGETAWSSRVRTNALEKLGHVLAALWEAIVNRPIIPDASPPYSLHDFKGSSAQIIPPVDEGIA